MEDIAKTIFSQKSFVGDSRVDFLCFSEALGGSFSHFCCLEDRLENSVCFKGYPGPWPAAIKLSN